MNTTLIPDYGAKSEDELLSLASDPEAITSEARSALFSELTNRSLNAPSRLEQFKEEQRKCLGVDDVSRAHSPLIYGMGSKIFGRAHMETIGTRQEYSATVFAVVFYFPLVPLATYRLFREQDSDRSEVLRKIDIDWSQVALVWVKALAIVAGILVLWPVLVRAKW